MIREFDSITDEFKGLRFENIFLQPENLKILHHTNPCGQRYYLIENESHAGMAVTYQLPLNIFTYSKFRLYLRVSIIGIPCSVSKQGFQLSGALKDEFDQLAHGIKGAKLILNCDDKMKLKHFHEGLTLPTCVMEVKWTCFDEYLNALRSHYRYRINKALKKGKRLQKTTIDNRQFDEELYRLYLEVYTKSQYKLEKLPIEFFRQFPASIIKFEVGSKPVGFVQIARSGKELLFILGGIDYALNHQYDIYMNMLLEILQTGIDMGVETIDFGQTAEECKLKLGCRLKKKYMYIGHANKFINLLIKVFAGKLGYRTQAYDFNVFKRGNQ